MIELKIGKIVIPALTFHKPITLKLNKYNNNNNKNNLLPVILEMKQIVKQFKYKQ